MQHDRSRSTDLEPHAHGVPDRAANPDPSIARLAAEKLRAERLLVAVLDELPDVALVLNDKRQILLANRAAVREIGVPSPADLVGKQVGEVMGCVRAPVGPAGCGSSADCQFCGTLQAIVESGREGTPAHREARMLVRADRGGALDLDVVVTPVVVDRNRYATVVLRDASARQRRHVLERLLFHDIMNAAGGLRGLVSVLRETENPTTQRELKDLLAEVTEQLVDTISEHKQLLAAESGEIDLSPAYVSIPHMLRRVRDLYARHPAAEGRTLVLGETPDTDLMTDANLLQRVLGNMTKNALEATPRGEKVLLSALELDASVVLRVHNPGVIPDQVRHQLFTRSFTTKGTGRGLGTYSVRLLTERYLAGRVSFTTSEKEGTTFQVELPKEWPGPQAM